MAIDLERPRLYRPPQVLIEERQEIEESSFETEEDLYTEEEKTKFAAIENGDYVGLYLAEISKTPLLTAKEEVSLAKRIDTGRVARNVLSNGRVLTKNQRGELLEKAADGQEACNHLVLANRRLVVKIAKNFRGRGLPFLDLISQGNIGLERAVKKYDYKKGYRFSTYATWWIRQTVGRAVSDEGRTMRIPVHTTDKVIRMHKLQDRLLQELGREASEQEIADEMKTSVEKVRELIVQSQYPVSLEKPRGEEEEDTSFGDFIPDETSPSPEVESERRQLSQNVSELLEILTPREQKILSLRYGLNGEELFLPEIGRRYGLTRERIRQIIGEALEKINAEAERRGLQEFLRR